MQKLQALGLVYFCYLFLFSGLEFTLSFLTHQRFHFTRYELIDKVLLSGIPSIAAFDISLFSMQQGKMFFFIGITMALIQGGYSRRIKPGHHVKAVRMVNLYCLCPRNHTNIPLQTDTPSLMNCVFFYFRQSWHWSQHLSSSVCHGIQQPCISACSCIHLVRFFFFFHYKKQNWLNILIHNVKMQSNINKTTADTTVL